jgi:hypothetical protein
MIERGPGVNFTDRQRIKRKAERWAAKFAALPPVERIAVLKAMGFDGSSPEPSMFRQKTVYERLLTEVCKCGHTWADHDDQEEQVCNGIDLFGCSCECDIFRPQHPKATQTNPSMSSPPMPYSGATKPAPRESAEPGGRQC